MVKARFVYKMPTCLTQWNILVQVDILKFKCEILNGENKRMGLEEIRFLFTLFYIISLSFTVKFTDTNLVNPISYNTEKLMLTDYFSLFSFNI